MPRAPRANRLTLLAATAVVGVFAVVTWQYRREMRAWYLLRQDFESLGTNEQGYREYRHRQTGIVFVRVPGGTFWMGTSKDEAERVSEAIAKKPGPRVDWSHEQPPHEVTLSSFLIAKYGAPGQAWERGKSCRAT